MFFVILLILIYFLKKQQRISIWIAIRQVSLYPEKLKLRPDREFQTVEFIPAILDAYLLKMKVWATAEGANITKSYLKEYI